MQSGMSDHEIVIFHIDGSWPCINKKKSHKIFCFDKGDVVGLKNQLQDFQQYFSESNLLQNSVEQNLKDAICATINKCIPTKYTKTCNKLP